MINPTITNQLFKSMHDIQIKFLEKIKELEKRIASLESKPQETYPDRTRIDFEGEGGTKVPTGENESDTGRSFEDYKIGDYLDFSIPYANKTGCSIIVRSGTGTNKCGYFGKWYIVAPINGICYKIWGHSYAEEC